MRAHVGVNLLKLSKSGNLPKDFELSNQEHAFPNEWPKLSVDIEIAPFPQRYTWNQVESNPLGQAIDLYGLLQQRLGTQHDLGVRYQAQTPNGDNKTRFITNNMSCDMFVADCRL